jgi:hypothetical protein
MSRNSAWLYSVLQSISESESELLYDWRFTANQFVLAPSPLRLTARIFFLQLNTCGHGPYLTSSLTRGWLSLTIAAGPRQGIHCRVRVPWDSRPYFTVSDSRLPFCRLLRRAGLRWRYSTPPPHGGLSWYGPRRKHIFCTDQLPSKGHPIVACVRSCGNMFTASLPKMGLCVTLWTTAIDII